MYENSGGHLLRHAVNRDAYEYLQAKKPYYIDRIEQAISLGMEANEIYKCFSDELGPDRQPLARRCAQAAAYIIHLAVENYGQASSVDPGTIKSARLKEGR
jgi:hypothetical protein